MKENKDYLQAIAQAKDNLINLNERGSNATSGDVLEFINSIFTPKKIAESELRVSIIGELIKTRQEKEINQKKLDTSTVGRTGKHCA